MAVKTEAYWNGYIAAQAGRSRECANPWSVQWLLEWLRGYDDEAVSTTRSVAEQKQRARMLQ